MTLRARCAAIAALALLAGGDGLAQDAGGTARVTPDDFAFGFTVEADGDASVLELSVPDALYRSIRRTDLGDLRVFNREGTVVPHALRHGTVSGAERPSPRPVSVFPVRGSAGDAGGRIRIVTNDQGAIIEATGASGSGGGPPSTQRVVSYLVDLGAEPAPPERLDLEWVHEPERGFTATVAVSASSDLAAWRTVVNAVTLADLTSGDARLRNQTIGLPATPERYLRIEWPESLRDVRLTGVRIVFAPVTQSLERRTQQIGGAVEDPEASTPGYVFDTGGAWPIDRAHVVFGERNRVLDGRLLSRAAPDHEWRARHSGVFYRLERNGTELASDSVLLPVTSDRYWRLEPTTSSELTGDIPQLQIGFVPHRVVFVRQGDAPFTVAFGSATVEPPGPASDRLLAVVERLSGAKGVETRELVSLARPSEIFALGGPARLQPGPPPLAWRTWILWGILCAGVALLAWMVWQLARRMEG